MLEINETAKRAIATNGSVFQSMIAMEECSELAQAISKCIRMSEEKGARSHLIEEMADVLICLGQLKSIYQVTDDELNEWTESKIERLERQLSYATE